MIFALYDLILLLVAALLIPWYLVRRVLGLKSRRGLRERLGWYAPNRLSALEGRRVLWIHAVSVGETRAAVTLLKALKQTFPNHALVITNVTETGHAVAQTIREVDLCLFFPLDLSFVVRRVLQRLNPQAIVVVETEIWPNLVRLAHQRKIPLMLVNGRISDRSFPRYRKLRGLVAPILHRFSAFCMQSALDAERIRALGARSEAVSVTGNLKFDMAAVQTNQSNRQELRERYRLPPDGTVWVAGSTHDGEERTVIETYRLLLETGRNIVLILVPRHPERAEKVGVLVQSLGFEYRLRSSLHATSTTFSSGQVLLVDTLGEIIPLYMASDVVFVGGSFVPVGGHNILEASLVRKPVIFGPFMHNFREISQLVLSAGAGYQVNDASELAVIVGQLLDEPSLAQSVGDKGYAMIAANTGATARTIGTLRAFVD